MVERTASKSIEIAIEWNYVGSSSRLVINGHWSGKQSLGTKPLNKLFISTDKFNWHNKDQDDVEGGGDNDILSSIVLS